MYSKVCGFDELIPPYHRSIFEGFLPPVVFLVSSTFKKFIFQLLQEVNLYFEDYSYLLSKIFLFSPSVCFLKEDTVRWFCSS